MKTTNPLLVPALLVSGCFGLAQAQTNSTQTFAERQREAERQSAIFQKEQSDLMHEFVDSREQNWMTNYYGKTVSSLGDIVSIQIDRRTRSTPDWEHRQLWQIIEEAKVQVYPEDGIPFGHPPVFAIEYSSGLRVQADACNVLIVLPDGRKGSAFLDTKPPKP